MSSLGIPVGIKLTETVDAIQKKVLYAMRDQLNQSIAKAVPHIQTAIMNRSRAFFETSKEAQALINGPLNKHFGIPQGEAQARVGAIIQTVINNISVTSTRVSVRGNNLGGGITVGVVVSDFSDVLANPEAKIFTDKGEELPWLEWLLIRGDEIIITDYDIRMGNYVDSRSGGAIMFSHVGGLWRVPPQYSGTIRDNWLTRSVLDVSDAYIDMIGDVIQQKIEATF